VTAAPERGPDTPRDPRRVDEPALRNPPTDPPTDAVRIDRIHIDAAVRRAPLAANHPARGPSPC
jgi:hypothetical protein